MQSPLQDDRLECFVWRIVIRIRVMAQQYEPKYGTSMFFHILLYCNYGKKEK